MSEFQTVSDSELQSVEGGWMFFLRSLSPSQLEAQMWLGTVTPEEGA